MFNGHQDGMRGIAGGNCAYTAQSYGASIQEIEMADMHTSKSGCGRRRRKLRITPIATKKAPPMYAKLMAAFTSGVSSDIRGPPCSSKDCVPLDHIEAPTPRSGRSARRAYQA